MLILRNATINVFHETDGWIIREEGCYVRY